ncbi:hypothetical protein GOODEAATRI_004639, partial [Goodea atripinnis]
MILSLHRLFQTLFLPEVNAHRSLTSICASLRQIAALESELMQLMKQNGIQVNNNNSNSSERFSAQQNIPSRAAAQPREVKEGSPHSSSIKTDCAGDSIGFPEGQ